MKAPVFNSYWIVPGKLAAGGHPAAFPSLSSVLRVRQLLESGIRLFVDLTEALEHPGYPEMLQREAAKINEIAEYYQASVVDMDIPTVPQMVEILDRIDAALNAGQPVYVHCYAGVGRTGTVVGCWLARHGQPGQAALDRLEELRRAGQVDMSMPSPIRQRQIEMVLDWPEGK